MNSSSALDHISVLDGKVVTLEKANKDEFKAAFKAAKKDGDSDTEWSNALLNSYQHITVTSPKDNTTFQILKQ